MKKILVIFFFAIILIFLIYKNTYKENNSILLIGEYNEKTIKLIELLDNKNIKTFLYDSVTYKELINLIKNNDYIVIKNKKVYLNQLISSSNIIYINVNNNSYKKKCINNKVSTSYLKNINNYKNKLLELINKFSSAKVIIINNSCDV